VIGVVVELFETLPPSPLAALVKTSPPLTVVA
jgi:hypothetical protein